MSARRTRRSGGTGRAGGSKCAWCKHMGSTVDACTWKPRGQQGWFMSGSDVASACFGHMVASVWDGSAVRQRNKNYLKRCLALSVAERGNGAGAPPQHAWAAALLDACKPLPSVQIYSMHRRRKSTRLATCTGSEHCITRRRRVRKKRKGDKRFTICRV